MLNLDTIKRVQNDINIVYTPLHGAGNVPVQRILREIGFKNVYVVPEQEQPNGDFPTVSYPNPEDANAFKLALELAEKVKQNLYETTKGTLSDEQFAKLYNKTIKRWGLQTDLKKPLFKPSKRKIDSLSYCKKYYF